jgi:hypothetical protein
MIELCFSQDTLRQHLKKHGLSSLKRAAELVTSRDNSGQAVAKAYLEVAKYCRTHSSTSR